METLNLRFEASMETMDRCYAINARGTLLLFQYAAKQMIKQGRGGRLLGASREYLSVFAIILTYKKSSGDIYIGQEGTSTQRSHSVNLTMSARQQCPVWPRTPLLSSPSVVSFRLLVRPPANFVPFQH